MGWPRFLRAHHYPPIALICLQSVPNMARRILPKQNIPQLQTTVATLAEPPNRPTPSVGMLVIDADITNHLWGSQVLSISGLVRRDCTCAFMAGKEKHIADHVTDSWRFAR
jgi:hypothetical protein